MALTTMYNGQVNSPQTVLNGAINSSVTSITVVDGTILPTAPMPLVISEGSKEPETVLMTNKVGNVLTVTRAFQGVAQSWGSGASIGRNFTAYDYNTLVDNTTTINSDLVTHKLNYVALNGRLDTIITTPTTEISVQEIIDARQSELSLGANLTGIKNDLATHKADNMKQINELESQVYIGEHATYKTKIFAHRGMESIAPENTIPAFEYCGEIGLYGVETDAQVTSDGVWIIHHDLEVDRMTDGTGNIADMTLAEIKALNIDTGTNNNHFPNLKIPTVEEFLKVCVKYNLMPLIEIKVSSDTNYFNDLFELIRKYNMEDRWALIIGQSSIEPFRALSRKVILHLLCTGTNADIDLMASYGNGAIHVFYEYVTTEMVNYAHSKGVKVNTWGLYTMTMAQNLISKGVDFIALDGIGVV